jgi:hypothetical protein
LRNIWRYWLTPSAQENYGVLLVMGWSDILV